MEFYWRFVNKATGTVIESSDLTFLAYELVELRGYIIPLTVFAEVRMTGYIATKVETDEDETVDIEISRVEGRLE